MTISLPMRWLAAGVPLSLLFDLALPPDSFDLLVSERAISRARRRTDRRSFST